MTIAFRRVKEPYGWLGNMSPHPIGVSDVLTFRTAEAFFQASRFSDDVIIRAIAAEKSPMAAKMVAKKYRDRMTVGPRSPKDLTHMRITLYVKVLQHPELRTALLATGDQDIVEDCTNRPNDSGLFWGAAAKLQGVDGPVVWEGTNTLGKMWMQLRTSLRDETR